jgi:penicillin-binding protein-related factor A (putative recombinase)
MTDYEVTLLKESYGIFSGNKYFQFEIEQTKNGHAFLLCPLFES